MNKMLYPVILHILRPLIRILQGKNIAFGEFSQLARQLYVEAAEQTLLERQEKATTSRIAIMTGLTRKDVAQLRQAEADTSHLAIRYSRGVRVIDGWRNDEKFRHQNGQPAQLPLVADDDTASFAQLVSSYSGDMPYRAMLLELQNSGLVELLADNTVRLLKEAYLPDQDEAEQLAILGQDVNLLIRSIGHNLQAKPDERFFQRKVRYDNLSEESVAEFRQLANRKSMELLLEFNAWLAKHDRDRHPDIGGQGRMSAGVGIYYFQDQENAPPTADQTPLPKDKSNKDS